MPTKWLQERHNCSMNDAGITPRRAFCSTWRQPPDDRPLSSKVAKKSKPKVDLRPLLFILKVGIQGKVFKTLQCPVPARLRFRKRAPKFRA